MIECCLEQDSGIQVLAAGGVEQFSGKLKAIKVDLKTRPDFRAIGTIRDADDNPQGAFQSVCDHLRNAGFDVPQSHGSFSNAFPSVGVFIVPDGKECGAIETLCRKSVEDSETVQCVEQYLQCLEHHDKLSSTNKDKSFVHAYLASTSDPVARVGEGARQGVWQFDSPAFKGILSFVRELSRT